MFNPIQFYEFGKQRLTFESTWKTDNTSAGSSAATQVKLPLISAGTYNMNVNWGDGTTSNITVWNQAQTTHTYSVAGTYTIKITGTCVGWQFNNTGDRLKILSIQSWGGLKLGTTQGNYFYGCSNLNLTSVTDLLNLTATTSLAGAFQGCTGLTTINRLNQWNVSNGTNFSSMFAGATIFNNGGSSDINNWILKTTGSVTLAAMFDRCSFNQPLNNWNLSAVISIAAMFRGNKAFNQNIGSWNVSNVTNFNNTFEDSVFNNGGSSDINNWNTIAVTTMLNMFYKATAFNQNIGNWNVSQVTNFASFMTGKTPATFSTANLDAIYNGWSSRPVKTPITITFGTAKYTSASSAGRAILTGAPNLWSITDGGM